MSILLLYKNTQGVNSHGLVGGLLGIFGLKVKSTNSNAYLLDGFSVGFILAYDKEDVSKYLVASFVFKYAEFGYVHTIYNEGISIPGHSNEYGSIGASGGSGNYQYNVIGFLGGFSAS